MEGAVRVCRANNAAGPLTLRVNRRRATPEVLEGALEYSARGYCAEGLKGNRDFFSPDVTFGDGVSEDYRNLLFDPQTSGGLLIAVSADDAEALLQTLHQNGGESAAKPQ